MNTELKVVRNKHGYLKAITVEGLQYTDDLTEALILPDNMSNSFTGNWRYESYDAYEFLQTRLSDPVNSLDVKLGYIAAHIAKSDLAKNTHVNELLVQVIEDVTRLKKLRIQLFNLRGRI